MYYFTEYDGRSDCWKLEAFDPDTDSIAVYLEQVEIYFAANSIPGEKRVAVLLSLIRGEAYALLHHLLAPQKPAENLEDLWKTLKNHYEPQKVVMAERFHFHLRQQAVGENVADLCGSIKKVSQTLHANLGFTCLKPSGTALSVV